MKKHAMNRKGASAGRLFAAGALAVVLAASPLTAFAAAALDGAAEGEAAPVEVTAPAEEVAPVEDAASGAADEAATTSVTVSYYEVVGYDHPEVTDGSGLLLLETRTFDGLKVGEEIEPWDYVVDMTDLAFFDGWADNIIADADPAKNQVQLHYLRTRWPLTIHYYAVSGDLGATPPVERSTAQEAMLGKADFSALTYRYLGMHQTPTQPMGQVIDSDLLAVPVDGLEHLGADRAEVTISNVPSNNEVNVFYYEASPTDEGDADEGDAAPVPPTTDGETDTDTGSGDTGNDDATDSETDAPQDTVIVEDDTPLAAAGEDGVLPLPQTGDGVAGILAVATALAMTAAGTLAALRRRTN